MDYSELQLLPLGASNFSSLRNAGQIYVDKTAFIYELASKREKFFLVRPRRFGKSLLLSTFESLFKYGLRDFNGLAIEKLWKEEKSYQVVRLDFSEIKNFSNAEQFQTLIDQYFVDLMQRNHYNSPLKSNNDGLRAFESWLAVQKDNSIVLLIDEYDAPLTACLSNHLLFDSVRMKFAELYAGIKSNDRVLRFFFMTGITTFRKASIFSELNSFTDLSLMPEFGSLLGFTLAEAKQFFSGYLDKASEILGMDRKSLLSEMTVNYDGFCFEKTATQQVIAPWSFLKFLSFPSNGFDNYWCQSAGNPTALQQCLKSHTLEPMDYFKPKFVPIASLQATAADVEHIDDLVLLTQAGYLTIKDVGTDSFLVGYPNKEVSDSMARLYRDQLLSSQSVDQLGAMHLRSDLHLGNVDSVVQQVNKLFLAIDYKKYPITDETTCRNHMQLFLTLGAYVRTYAELSNALGRSDLEVETSELHWVFELKFLKNEDKTDDELNVREAERLLDTAIDQIKERHYGEADFSGKKLIRVALVFSEKERQFIRWRTADL